MDKDIQQEIEQFEKEKNELELEQQEVAPNNEKELKQQLINRGIEERKELEYTVGKGDDVKVKKPRLSTTQVAYLLQDYFDFCLFDMNEGTRPALYLQFEGIYTQNETIFKRYIFYVENTFNTNQADDVIYKISNLAEVKEKTQSRYLIPVQNGVFNLETQELEDFSPDYVFTSKIATPYKENVQPPNINVWTIETWLEEIANYDEEIYQLLWQVINDSLNGNYSRKKAIFLVGEGNNGKGTFQTLITNVVGDDNVANLKVNEFDHKFKLSLLEEKTVCIGDDVPASVYIDDSSNFNSVITNDPVLIERKWKDAYSTTFSIGVIQSTNDMPKFKNKTKGTTRRITIVPFLADFNGKTENPAIKEDYLNRQDVLEYVLHEAIHMDFEKFITPNASEKEMNRFIQDNNPIADFKASVFDEWNVQRVPIYVVYGFYKDFCNENGYKYVTKRNFTKEFEKLLNSDWDKRIMKIDPSLLAKRTGGLPFNVRSPNAEKSYSSYINERLKVM